MKTHRPGANAMFIDVLLFGVIAGWLLGGKLVNLGSLQLRGMYWFIALGALQVVMQYSQAPERKLLYTALIMLASFMGAVLLWVNHGLPGVRLVTIGLLLNIAVMVANGGRMPVSEEAAIKSGQGEHLPQLVANQSSRHLLLTDRTRLAFLGDVIPVPKPYPYPRVISVGDILIAIGVVQLITSGMKARHHCLTVAIPGSLRR